jgi:hypothetical protein
LDIALVRTGVPFGGEPCFRYGIGHRVVVPDGVGRNAEDSSQKPALSYGAFTSSLETVAVSGESSRHDRGHRLHRTVQRLRLDHRPDVSPELLAAIDTIDRIIADHLSQARVLTIT